MSDENMKKLDAILGDLDQQVVILEGFPDEDEMLVSLKSTLELLEICFSEMGFTPFSAAAGAFAVQLDAAGTRALTANGVEQLGVFRKLVLDLRRAHKEQKSIEQAEFADLEANCQLGLTQAEQDGEPNDTEIPEVKAKTEQVPSDTLDLSQDLLDDFITEATEHLESVEDQVLELEDNPKDSEALNAIFRAFHTVKGTSGFFGFDGMQELAHVAENLLDLLRDGELPFESRAASLILQSKDILLEMTQDISPETARDKAPRELIAQLDAACRGEFSSAPTKPPAIKIAQPDKTETPKENKPKRKKAQKEVVRVHADRLDLLMNLIGELVIAESIVSEADEINLNASEKLVHALRQLSSVTRDLQSLSTSLRMVPIKGVFQKMRRLVRDLSNDSGKTVDFVVVGEDTEIDKSLVERIADPLVHMIRNSMDHGIEDAETRKLNNKPEQGQLIIEAAQRGGSIYISVEDDGKGLDSKILRAKAIEKGLITEDAELTEREAQQLIMAPGFSTAATVTNVSGRGVGMDVVKRTVESLRGQIELDSTLGQGTRFTMRLPLTTAIIDGLVTRVANEYYILPTISVLQSVQLDDTSLFTLMGEGEAFVYQDRTVPMVRLSSLYNVKGAERNPEKAFVIVLETDGKPIGLMVDEVLGKQQVVIKSLNRIVKGIPGLAGSAILSSGQVGLIIDIEGLIQLANTPIFIPPTAERENAHV